MGPGDSPCGPAPRGIWGGTPIHIHLADLGHDTLTRSSDTDPVGVANLATCLSSRLAGDLRRSFEDEA
jgi:hypothetical protein